MVRLTSLLTLNFQIYTTISCIWCRAGCVLGPECPTALTVRDLNLLKTLLIGMDHDRGLKNRGTFASEASGPQNIESLHLGGNLKLFGYGCVHIGRIS